MFYQVDEQLRAARLQGVFRKAWPYAAALAVAAVVVALGVWGWRQHQAEVSSKASMAYADAVQALETGDLNAARARFAALSKSGAAAYATLALMQSAGMSLKAGDPAAAARLLDQATKAAPDAILGDAARLQAAYLVMDTAPYDQVYGRLLPLTGKDRPYRALAREALAVERLATGRLAQARGDFQVIALSQDTSDASRNRAQAALALIRSGATGAIGPIARGAVGLTPQAPPANPQLGQPGQLPDQQPAPAGAPQ